MLGPAAASTPREAAVTRKNRCREREDWAILKQLLKVGFGKLGRRVLA
jgi:hypothetical protein